MNTTIVTSKTILSKCLSCCQTLGKHPRLRSLPQLPESTSMSFWLAGPETCITGKWYHLSGQRAQSMIQQHGFSVPGQRLINKSLCMGFEKKVTITFCDLSNCLHTTQLACKAALLLTAMSTPLEDAMDTLIRIFHHYSGKEGDRYKLSKGELKELLTSELTDFLSGQKDPLLVDKIMKDLDSNKDNEVDFNEFVILVAALTVACNDFFEEQLKKEGY
ncbi:unnamed protein product [Bubo scandiacus]